MKLLTQYRLFLWSFGRFKIPLIGHLKPKLISLDDQQVVIKLPLNRRSKNHLNSMYFGALSVGADLAGALHGFYHAKQAKVETSLAFKSFEAAFLRRPEADVYFVGNQGLDIKTLISESQKTQQRINKMIDIKAFVNYPQNPEEVANFRLELSIKVL